MRGHAAERVDKGRRVSGAKGWNSGIVIGALTCGVVLLAVFALIESRVAEPLLPLRIVSDRNRGGSYLTVGSAVVGMYGLFLLLTFYFQDVRGYSAARPGVAFLPMSAAVLLSSTVVARKFLPLVPPRFLIVPGLVVAAVGMATLTRLGVHASYVTHVLPGEVLLGLGMGCVFVPAMSTATSGVGPRDAGIASATANTAQQIGASLGIALLNTIAASSTASYLIAHQAGPLVGAEGLVHGYTTASAGATIILIAGAIVAGLLVDVGKPEHTRGEVEGGVS